MNRRHQLIHLLETNDRLVFLLRKRFTCGGGDFGLTGGISVGTENPADEEDGGGGGGTVGGAETA